MGPDIHPSGWIAPELEIYYDLSSSSSINHHHHHQQHHHHHHHHHHPPSWWAFFPPHRDYLYIIKKRPTKLNQNICSEMMKDSFYWRNFESDQSIWKNENQLMQASYMKRAWMVQLPSFHDILPHLHSHFDRLKDVCHRYGQWKTECHTVVRLTPKMWHFGWYQDEIRWIFVEKLKQS